MERFDSWMQKNAPDEIETFSAKCSLFCPWLQTVSFHVGKTSLLMQYKDRHFLPSHDATIGLDIHSFTIALQGKFLRFEARDCSGDEDLKSLVPNFARKSSAAILVYDITNEDSFNEMKNWKTFVQKTSGVNTLFLLTGNKLDEKDKRMVSMTRMVMKSVGDSILTPKIHNNR